MKKNILLIVFVCLSSNGLYATENRALAERSSTSMPKKRTYDSLQTEQLEKALSGDYNQNRSHMLNLLELRADPDTMPEWDGSLLHKACEADDLPVVEAVLAYKADPNLTTSFLKETPIMAVTSKQVARCLLDHNANIKNCGGQSHLNLLHWAALNKKSSIGLFGFLCNAGLDVNQKEVLDGGTPLPRLFLFHFDNPPYLLHNTAALLLAGADYQSKNKAGETFLDRVQKKPDNVVHDVQALIRAAPHVRQERENNKAQITVLLNECISSGPAGIVTQYAFKPVWDKTCLPLFEKHSGVNLTRKPVRLT